MPWSVDAAAAMTAADLIDLIYKAILALGVLVGIGVSLRNAAKIQTVHLMMNSQLTELLRVNRAEAHSAGAAEARAADKLATAGAAATLLETARTDAATTLATAADVAAQTARTT